MTDNDLPPLPPSKGIQMRDIYTRDDLLAYAHAARAPLLAEIERLRACVAEVRKSAESRFEWWPGDHYSRGIRQQARDTLAILDRHAADGEQR